MSGDGAVAMNDFSMNPSGPVLLFDGECGLCVRCVQALLQADGRARLRFAPLQGVPAQEYLRERGLPATDFDSIIFVPDWARRAVEAPRFRTDALFAALAVVGGIWYPFSWLRVLPKAWRDGVYRLVARSRRRLFGRGDLGCLRARAQWAARSLEQPL
jgi:predicted DCC family thiol-disulfide oxidoreductase YuxK